MIVVDTSVWVDHFRHGDDRLIALLGDAQVLTHPFVVGELACGNLRNRKKVLLALEGLPRCIVAENAEVLLFIERQKLMGRGIGYVDVHLLAATRLAGAMLWTRDKPLHRVAESLALAAVVA